MAFESILILAFKLPSKTIFDFFESVTLTSASSPTNNFTSAPFNFVTISPTFALPKTSISTFLLCASIFLTSLVFATIILEDSSFAMIVFPLAASLKVSAFFKVIFLKEP